MTIREDPPPPALPAGHRNPSERLWAERLAGCLAEPGTWFKLAGDWGPATLSRLKRAAAVAAGQPDPRQSRDGRRNPPPKLPPGPWEFRSRRIEYSLRSEIWAVLVSDSTHPDSERDDVA